jgi:hypothetical protein
MGEEAGETAHSTAENKFYLIAQLRLSSGRSNFVQLVLEQQAKI